MTKDKYPASQLFTMITELLHELNLPYDIPDVYSFGYVPSAESDLGAAVFVEVFNRDELGVISGTERIVRYIDHDVNYKDWGQPPTDYPVIG